MKRIILPLLLVLAFFTSCHTTQKLYEAKEYDQVILTTGPRALSGRASIEEMELLAASYHQANQADHERILALKASGQPDVWPEIYERYTSMKGRQEILTRLPKEERKHLNITALDIDDELINAHNKAESYLVAKTGQLLASETPTDIDEAKKLIRQLMRVSPDSAPIGEFQLKAMMQQAGELHTEFEYNDRRRPLPHGFEEAVLTFDEEELAKFPLGLSNTVHPALMKVEVTDFSVSANRDDAVSFKETKGSSSATVTDHALSKTATVKATVTFFYKDPDPVTDSEWNILQFPNYEASSKFSYNYSTVEGDRNACSEQTLQRLKQQPIPFPTDESLLLDAAREMNDLIAKTIMK